VRCSLRFIGWRDHFDLQRCLLLIYGTHALGRPISRPPGIPAIRVKALRGEMLARMSANEFQHDTVEEFRLLPVHGVSGLGRYRDFAVGNVRGDHSQHGWWRI